MTIEEKARAYDEAIKIARIWKDKSGMPKDKQGILDDIFPELRESEDEKIRKALIDYFDDANKADENPLQSYGIHTDKAIAWLEKQGGQKPAEWSEEYEKEVAVLEAYIRSNDWTNRHIDRALGIVDKLVNKVKSLKSYTYWKPTEEQIKALCDLNLTGSVSSPEQGILLIELYKELKKL